MLIECVLGAIGLAIDQAASEKPSVDPVLHLQNKTDRLKQVLRRRTTSLVRRRRRIEVLKNRLLSVTNPQKLERLRAALQRREQAYQERMNVLWRGRQKLARWQEELRLLKTSPR